MESKGSSSSKGKAPARRDDDHDDLADQPVARPTYAIAGTGSLSRDAARLAALLDNDSGYGGSVLDYEPEGLWRGAPAESEPDAFASTHGRPSLASGSRSSEDRVTATRARQMHYNHNRTVLSRAITKTVESLRKLQEMNAKSPMHYPSVQRAGMDSSSSRPRSGPRSKSEAPQPDSRSDMRPPRPPVPPRAETSTSMESSLAASSLTAESGHVAEPYLVTSQLAQELSILKLDLHMGHVSRTELVHSLGKSSISALLHEQISKTIRHLATLRERIEDVVSKVLVTGDLNAGKSTFCNALLGRKVLPEDQQPCTSTFCVVLDVRENGGIEEVHAVPLGQTYNLKDERTYCAFRLSELDKIVVNDERWSQCIIYIQESRSAEKSLLNNGVVDIALIDAPGLNMDSVVTTANYAKQEEIDVVVFVVSAANHFTQSAKEFVFHAAKEKAYMFMVVNGFDNIRDQGRCQEMILKQIQRLSPTTSKDAAELVHFVSCNAVPTVPSDSAIGSGGGSGAGDPGDDDDRDSEHSIRSQKHRKQIQDFERLEASLRRFVLERRARSKLAPAKTYLTNLLGDLNGIATANCDVLQAELHRVTKELDELEPELEKSKRILLEASKATDREIESTISEVCSNTQEVLGKTINNLHSHDFGMAYPGIFGAYQYADDLKHAMLGIVAEKVGLCEEYARERTVVRVSTISKLGILHLHSKFPDFHFRPEIMFQRKRDALARQINLDVHFSDFFDLSGLWKSQEQVTGASLIVTVTGIVGGRLIGGLEAAKIVSSNRLGKLVVPGIIVTAILAAACALTSVPTSLSRRLAVRVAAKLATLDYVHGNTMRISAEVRRALRFPADQLRGGLERCVENLLIKKSHTDTALQEAEIARKYFDHLVRESGEIWEEVKTVDVEGPPPGVAAMF